MKNTQLDSQSQHSTDLKPPWERATNEEWNDWHWQLSNRIRTLRELQVFLKLTENEVQGIINAATRFRMDITPFFARLIDRDDAQCPIRRQVIPMAVETLVSGFDFIDPVAEERDSPAPA